MSTLLRHISGLKPPQHAAASLLCLALLLGSPGAVVQADDAPAYETPEGLAVGVPDTTVRMADEEVDVQVVEQGSASLAEVTATFDMANDGPTVELLTGFPNTYNVQDGGDCCYLNFSSANISNFRAWTEDATYTPAQQKISVGPYKDQPWFVWNMSYPHGKTVRVHVTYQQKLGEQSALGDFRIEYVGVFYVLRTGALWSGNIGRAHITFEALNGGGFIGADGATSATNDRIEWNFTDFKPTSDVGTAYIFATPWTELQAAETGANQPGASSADLLRAAQDASLLLNAGATVRARLLNEIVDHYGPLLQQWATGASVLRTADSWKALGDAELFGSSAIWRFGIRCWPEAAVSAYQHAADLGSDSAAEELASLHSGGMYGLRPGVSDASSLPACDTGAQPESHPESAQPATAQTVPDTLTDAVRADILSAVDRANSGWAAATQSLDASSLNGAVAGQELANDQAELAKLRSQGQTRKNVNTASAVTDVTLDAPGHATVRTHETWYAETYQASSGRLLQRTAPTTYDETYTVEYLTGSWIVTKNDL